MADDQTTTDGPTSEHIDVDDEEALQAWATKLDATADQIRQAVQEVGNLAADVEMHLKGSHATTNADREAEAEAIDKPD